MKRNIALGLGLTAVLTTILIACSDTPVTPTPTADAGPGADTGPAKPTKDIVDTAIANGSFKTLVAATQAAGLEGALRGAGPLTVFAPTDDAFAKLPTFLTAKLVTAPYKTELGLILKYHVLSGNTPASAVLGKKQDVPSLLGANLSVDGTSGKVVINGGPSVVIADVAATNGTIHAVDGVILPSIVDTAINYQDGATKFSTLVAAIKASSLLPTLSGPGSFTIFAPTDAAFAKIPKVTLDGILADKAKLDAILKYHAVSSVVYEKDVAAGDVTTLNGAKIKITTAGGVKINDTTAVVFTDIPCSNGVIHVIDSVLLPATN
jgi:transforming growth factor-beta-induced protein